MCMHIKYYKKKNDNVICVTSVAGGKGSSGLLLWLPLYAKAISFRERL